MTTPAQPRIDFPRVRAFLAHPGHVYDRGKPAERTFSAQDVADIVRNFDLLCTGEDPVYEVPVAEGHIVRMADGSHTAVPAVGAVARAWPEGQGGNELFVSLADVDPGTKADMDAGRWRSVSVELWDSPEQAEIPEHLRRGAKGLLLKNVSLLGAWQPRVKGMGRPWKAGEGGWSPADHPARYLCADEPAPAEGDAKAEQLKVARQAGFGEAFLGMLSDDVLTALITDVAGRALAAAGVGTDGGGTMTREQMIQELVKLGEDAATLQQMDDAALKALYQQKKGAASPPAPTKMGEGSGGVVRTEPVPAGVMGPDAIRQYAEACVKTATARTAQAGVPQRVDAFCAEMIAGPRPRLTPGQVGTREQPGPTRLRLLRAGAVMQFGEGPGELERQMEEIRQGPVVRQLGELIPDPQGGGADPFEERLKRHYEGRAARLKRD